ncbi:MAG: DUF357 domain-containing protein [Methanoregula sp.]|jgi:hypothetical protein|uniref:DUF357 domain-containing protein n=1 Tax=Methanoregula sp. TaxID=2052170 RepID=UPI0025F12FBF|nr:DUF357 domain-containing protein [Methanoregula sp.]MCK9630489.1 DUF357 domain-containing protein [Methanoregula sp.]
MNLHECQALLAGSLAGTRCNALEGSPLWHTGQSVLRMASAYESDGRTFMTGEDPVNAMAAFLYGLGWLHCGIASGLLVRQEARNICPFTGTFERVPVDQSAKLDEKTGRYAHLLTTAIDSVSTAPYRGTPAHAFAVQVTFIAGVYLARGNRVASDGSLEEALACFSYGHGWIDAGVQAGLFSIHAHHEIFTVD